MNQAIAWWIVVGLLVAAELATGTFYLLMLALGAGASALAAHLGLSMTAQMLTGALVGGAAVALWHLRRSKQMRLPAQADRDVNLDIGQTVQVQHWQDDGRTTVKYRGTDWQARFQGEGQPQSGRFVIRAIDGSCLLLEPA
ncbi:NfeD family protein [Pelomonas sp. V22]|uniref:NfeD family protein n=1 Tax=Pelomonas sp. V22 TaxID=2822139 RepID=UPI0024A8437C|nr:NfeD family protein [Pelomonas sp. V22]MDI4633447.1 NfeD family protein [Pelomonas sp. V22]